MIIRNHWLEDPVDGILLEKAPMGYKADITPKIIVIHYGVTTSLDRLVSIQQHQGYGAHLSIDGWWGNNHTDSISKIVQHIPFNKRAGHAGLSKWGTHEQCNNFSIGIEISNPGPLIKHGDQYYPSWDKQFKGKPWSIDEVVPGVNKLGYAPGWKYWAAYTDQEIDLCVHTCTLLKNEYPTIVDVVGHEDIAPGRKLDPGPAFIMEFVREQVFNRRDPITPP